MKGNLDFKTSFVRMPIMLHKKHNLENLEETPQSPVSHERYTGMNDTVLDGEDALRRELATSLQMIKNSLSGNAPTLYALEARKMFEQIGKDLDSVVEIADPVTRQEAYYEVADSLNHAARYLELSGEVSQNDEVKKRFGPHALKDSERATLIVPSDWDDDTAVRH